MRWLYAGTLLVLTLAHDATAQSQAGRITGVVTSSDAGRPLEGVRVVIVGTRMAAATRADGRYVIAGVPAGTYQVRASMLGFAPRSMASVGVAGAGGATADFRLDPQAQNIEKVVVTGYGTSSRRELTGAIASVSGEDLTVKAAPTSAISNALQGKAAGVQVTTNSGVPGAGASVRVRGTNSITANSEPLYVIDGIPAAQGARSSDPTFNPLNSIDPNDIESIDILKDASATAIYGARGGEWRRDGHDQAWSEDRRPDVDRVERRPADDQQAAQRAERTPVHAVAERGVRERRPRGAVHRRAGCRGAFVRLPHDDAAGRAAAEPQRELRRG